MVEGYLDLGTGRTPCVVERLWCDCPDLHLQIRDMDGNCVVTIPSAEVGNLVSLITDEH
jgi:hypothetical protein